MKKQDTLKRFDTLLSAIATLALLPVAAMLFFGVICLLLPPATPDDWMQAQILFAVISSVLAAPFLFVRIRSALRRSFR